MTSNSSLSDLLASMHKPAIKPDVLLSEMDELLRRRPPIENIGDDSDEVLAWRGRVEAVLTAWDSATRIDIVGINTDLSGALISRPAEGYKRLIALLHKARYTLRLQTIGPLSIAIGKGEQFDYFDEVRSIIEKSSVDVLFVDPYLDANFVSRYLPFVQKGTAIRLLGRKSVEGLLSSVDAFVAQYGAQIELGTTSDLHDRYLFVDRKECFQSGASFKDGGVHTPTTLTQITDAFDAMARTYETLWNGAKIHR